MTILRVFLVLFTVFLLLGSSRAEEKLHDFRSELPRIPPVDLENAIDTLSVEPGYLMELAAHEPLVTDPVALAFDEYGRLFVVEMRGYSEQGDENLGTVRLLTDTDVDGKFDHSSVFVDQLSWPTAICCYDGGVFIGVAPDIIYCKDINGDGRADIHNTVFTGFGKSNVQGLLNSFQWGLDNRIHGATSSSGGQVHRTTDLPASAINLRGRDFSFNPATLEIRAESGGGQHGMSFDHWGHKFNCSNSDHLRAVIIPDRYLARNPYFALPSASESIAVDGPQAEVYRRSPVEPWRTLRTRLRVAGEVPGVVEGGGRAAGYFTSATGITIYDGDAWPHLNDSEAMVAVVGDVGSNIIHRKQITPDGISFKGERIDDQHEFVASTDIWFRPVQFCNGPDGALYVADFHREVIEHPDSLPLMIKEHLDLTSGRDRGRIYRLAPIGFSEPDRKLPGDAITSQLVAMLEHSNGWHRTTAARLLFEQQNPSAAPLLEQLVLNSVNSQARVTALNVLDGLNKLNAGILVTALSDKNHHVRENAVLLSERLASTSAQLRDKLFSLKRDPRLRVRFQLALSLGEVLKNERERENFSSEESAQEKEVEATVANCLADLLRLDGKDHWMRAAVLSSSLEVLDPLIEILQTDEHWASTETGKTVLQQLLDMSERRQTSQKETELPSIDRSTVPIHRPPKKQDVIDRYLLALENESSVSRGADIFEKTCSVCHDVEHDEGGIAPSVASFRNRGNESILTNIIDPNRDINPQYMSYNVLTNAGKTFSGMIIAESATSITLASGRDSSQTILRIDIEEIVPTGISLMPENLDQQLDEQQMADLIDFLTTTQ